MAIEVLRPSQVDSAAVGVLGLDATSVDLSSPEALAAALRRAASFLCPTTPTRLVGEVARTLEGLVREGTDVNESLRQLLDALVSYGDLLELPAMEEGGAGRRSLYLGSPGFVRRQSGACLILGVRPEAEPLLSHELAPLVECERHTRKIPPQPDLDVPELLLESGLREVPESHWLRCPRPSSPDEVVGEFDCRLEVVGPSGEIKGLEILDPRVPVTYYRGRWRGPSSSDEGRFVARRPRAFGADLWCYVELVSGRAVRLLDLLPDPGPTRACDVAWRLQAAIDAIAGHGQRLRVRPSEPARGTAILDLFAPPPSWLQRRWDVLGTPVVTRGSVISYGFDASEADEEISFARELLWLEIVDDRGKGGSDGSSR